MIRKIYSGNDQQLNEQIHEIVRNQFANTQNVDIVFTAANKEVQVNIGFYCTDYVAVRKTANIDYWYIKSDKNNMYFKASGAGTVTIKPIRGGN